MILVLIRLVILVATEPDRHDGPPHDGDHP
jgi:hypothetical protein